jgi:hypothetical protein
MGLVKFSVHSLKEQKYKNDDKLIFYNSAI